MDLKKLRDRLTLLVMGRHMDMLLIPSSTSQFASLPVLYAADANDSDDEGGHNGYHAGSTSGASNMLSNTFRRSRQAPAESSRPLANAGAVPAGFSGYDEDFKHGHSGKMGGMSDPFEDEDGPSAYAFTPEANGPYGMPRRGRWQRFREDHLTDVDWYFGLGQLFGRKSRFEGVPREVQLNDPEGNRVKGFEKNTVATGKYGPLTFLPKFLFCEWCRSSQTSETGR